MNQPVKLTTDQIIGAIHEMPPEQCRMLLYTLAERATVNREERMDYAESQIRQLCQSRGLDWDAMTEVEREDFIDDLIHEDRECSR